MTAALSTRPQRISSLAADRDPRVAKLWLNLPSRSSNVAQPPLDTPSVSSTATLVESSRREKLLTPPPSSTPSSRKIRPLPSTPDAKSPRALPPVPQSAPLAPAQRQRPGHRVTASTSSIPRHPSVLIPGRHSSHARTANFLFVPPASQRPATGDFDPTPSMTASVFPAIAAREIADELERLSIKGPDDADEENDSISPLDEDDDLDEEFSVQVVRGVAYRSADVKRVSRNWHGKWVRREGGLQFDNPDYTSIMKALRAL